MAGRGESDSPIMFREIHKNAWLKRLQPAPADVSRLLPHKKQPARAQWTLLCVHDGSRPWLEQYSDAAAVPLHRAAWRVSLRAVRHVSPTLRPCSAGGEYAFVIATESAIVRMAAPDWDSMQEWVVLLRTKLRELRALGGGENLYGAAPAARAPTRDPTSPLPPTPPAPAIRVPGIEQTPASSTRTTTQNQETEPNSESGPQEVLQNHNTADSSQPNNTDNSELGNAVETNNSANTTINLNNSTNASENNTDSSQSVTSTANSTPTNVSVVNQIESSDSASLDSPTKNVSTTIVKQKSSPQLSPTNSFSQSQTLSNIATVTTQNVSLSTLTSHKDSFADSITSLLSQQSENAETRSAKSKNVPAKGVTKICGQNICLDDSVLSRSKRGGLEPNESDDEFFTEFDKMSLKKYEEKLSAVVNDGVSRILLESVGEKVDESKNKCKVDSYTKVDLTKKLHRSEKFRQRVLVSVGSESESNLKSLQIQADNSGFDDSTKSATNVTVIQVSNHKRQPPHTAIPVLGSDSDVFHFHFNQKLTIDCPSERRNSDQRFVNVVNTGDQVQIQNLVSASKENVYGTIFNSDKAEEEPYGHISLTTTVKINNDNVITGDINGDSVYERLCLASTSNRTEDNNRNLTNDTSVKQNIEASCSTNDNKDINYEFLYLGNNRTNVSVSRSKSQREADGLQSRLLSCQKDLNESFLRVKTQHDTTVGAKEDKQEEKDGKRDKRAKAEVNGVSRCSRSPLRENGVNYQRFDKQVPNSAKSMVSHKGLLKRGLTELSFLSKLRNRGQLQVAGRAAETECRSVKPQSQQDIVSPSRQSGVVRRARPETRHQEGRRRSSSLSGEASPPEATAVLVCGAPPQSLRARQAAALSAEQLRPALLRLRRADTRSGQSPPLALVDAFGAVWVAGWCNRVASAAHGRLHCGDWLAAVDGTRPHNARHARALMAEGGSVHVDLLFHRVPHGKIFVVTKDREDQGIGLHLNADAEITACDADSPAARAGVPPVGARWALTEVNSRPLNLLKGAGAQAQSRLESRGAEVSVLLQPAALVLRLRQGLKAHRNATEYVVQ